MRRYQAHPIFSELPDEPLTKRQIAGLLLGIAVIFVFLVLLFSTGRYPA